MKKLDGIKTVTFSSLPDEIYLIILWFVVDPTNLSIQRAEQISFVANFQSLNKKIVSSTVMQEYFNEFWNFLFVEYFALDELQMKEFELLENEMKKKQQLKRKILLSSYIKFDVLDKIPNYYYYDNTLQGVKKNNTEFTVVMLGQSSGKSAIAKRYILGEYIDEYDGNIADFYLKQVKVDDETSLLNIADFFGYDEGYMKKSECFICVCSVNDESSITYLRESITYLLELRKTNDLPIVFAINKIDLQNHDPQSREKSFALIYSMIKDFSLLNTFVMETSAKTNLNIDALFEQVVRQFRRGVNSNPLELLRIVMKKDTKFLDEINKKAAKMFNHVTMNCNIT